LQFQRWALAPKGIWTATVESISTTCGFWPIVGLYILAALLMKSDPTLRVKQGTRHCFDCHFTYAKHDAADRIKRKWQHLEKRIRRMENKAI